MLYEEETTAKWIGRRELLLEMQTVWRQMFTIIANGSLGEYAKFNLGSTVSLVNRWDWAVL